MLFNMPRLCSRFVLCCGFFLLALSSGPSFAQKSEKRTQAASPQETLTQHYQAARTFAVAGDNDRAAAEYRAFLAEALHQFANVRVTEGSFLAADQYYEDALAITPDDPQINVDYSTGLLQQGDLENAQLQAQKAVALQPENIKAQYLLGRVLFARQDYKGAKDHMEAAVKDTQGDVTFDLGYDLAITYLMLKDVNRASLLFDEMMIGFGNTARLHIYFGHAYLMTDFHDRAITEFKEALAKDPKIKDAHYFLGLAYLSRDEDKGWDENAAEDRAEIVNNPDDFRPHYDLGNIALHQHREDEAEKELKRASELQPDNPDPLIALGELLVGERRLPDAEAAMSKAIALTKDPSQNGYQVARAYYVLGRVQVETGRRGPGMQNLKISAELREKSQVQRMSDAQSRETTAATAHQRIAQEASLKREGPAMLPPEQQKQLEAYFDGLKPAIADAYNNLGVAAGGHKDYATALADFQKAQQWYPNLETLDRNIGLSAFNAGKYQDAILPLWHALQRNPNDQHVRAALGLSYFSVQNYEGAAETLRPMEKIVRADPGAGLAYGVSLVKTGQYENGVAVLNALEQSNPKIATIHASIGDIDLEQGIFAKAAEEYQQSLTLDPQQPRVHYALGVALLREGKPTDAVPQLRSVLATKPSDAPTLYYLATALLETQQKDEAQGLLQQVIQNDPKYADAYYQLGKLQLESGDAKQAVSNLESAAALSPDRDYIHYQLSLAYGREARADDAQREMQLYQALKTERRGDHEQPRSN